MIEGAEYQRFGLIKDVYLAPRTLPLQGWRDFVDTSDMRIQKLSLRLCLGVALVLFTQYLVGCDGDGPPPAGTFPPRILDYPLVYPNKSTTPTSSQGSTHELAFNPIDPRGLFPFWISGDNYDYIAEFFLNGRTVYHPMPAGSMPHGVDFDSTGQLWVSFESFGQLARLN
jgi:hypothetical protein